MKAEYVEKQKEYEAKKARAKALKLRLTCTICGTNPKTLLNCPCGTTQCVPAHERVGGAVARDLARPRRYCSTDCQRIDWRDRGHRKACKKIRNERAAEAAQAEAPTPPASPPKEIFYGPAPRSHADEVRARIAAEHEAARLRREANPEREPYSARWGSRCPICMEEWNVNEATALLSCCCRRVCDSCDTKIVNAKMPCPLCRLPFPSDEAEYLARLRRHAKSEVPEAVGLLGNCYRQGTHVTKSEKKAVKLYKRAVELGNLDAMSNLAFMYEFGHGVKVDKAKNLQLLRMAADRGHAMAQKNLGGIFFQEGKVEEAFKLFMLSAEQGFTDAEYLVGVIMLKSWPGAPADREEEGRRWLVRAAAKGQEEAKQELARSGHLA